MAPQGAHLGLHSHRPGHPFSAPEPGCGEQHLSLYLAPDTDRGGRLVDYQPYSRRLQMNRYMMISRLRWPALLLLTGIIALLNQAHILSWGHAWPLYLILLGVLALAERATLSSDPPYPY